MLDYTFKYMFFLFLFFIVGSRWPTMTKPNLHKSNIISFVQTTKYYTYWTVNQNRTIDRCLEWEFDTDKTALKTQILLKFFILSSYHPIIQNIQMKEIYVYTFCFMHSIIQIYFQASKITSRSRRLCLAH